MPTCSTTVLHGSPETGLEKAEPGPASPVHCSREAHRSRHQGGAEEPAAV